MIPEELLESVFEELKMKLGDGLMQMIFPFLYDRNSDYSVKGLRRLKDRLEGIIERKECLITTPKSIHCFFLKFIETWRTMAFEGKTKELKKQFLLMREIFNIFRKQGVVLMDEVDLILNCNNETNFPMGKLFNIKERDMDLLLEIYDILLHSKTLKPYLKAEFDNKNNEKTAVPFDETIFHTKLKPLIIEELLDYILAPKKDIDPIKLEELKKNRKLLISFLSHDDQYEKAYEYVNAIIDPNIHNQLFLAYQELNTLLPLTLGIDCNEDYGIRSQIFATPLSKGQPIFTIESGKQIEGMRFADPFKCANLTYQAYYHSGIPISFVKRYLNSLQNVFIEDLNNEIELKNSSAYPAFSKLVGNKNKYHPLKLSEKEIQEITDYVNEQKDLRNMFFKMYILPTIQFHGQKSNSNLHTIGFFFNRKLGFSGTPTNYNNYPDEITTIHSPGTDAKTLFALLGSAGMSYPVEIIEVSNPLELINILPCHTNDLALIDNGAYLKGKTIEEVVQALLNRFQNDKTIKGVAYFDDQGKKMILQKGKFKPIPLKDSSLKPEERFTIYPKPFTTGADIPQSSNATAYFTVGRNLALRDFLQGVYRLRKINESQKIRILINKEVQNVINTTLKRQLDTPIKIEDVILFSVYNQSANIGNDNYTSIKQKMLEVIKQAILELIFDEELVSPDLAAELFTRPIEELFAPCTGTEPNQLYKGKELYKEAEGVLNEDLKYCIDLLTKILHSSPFLEEKLSEEFIQKEVKNKINLKIVPEKIIWRENDQKNTLTLSLQNTEETTNVETQVQTLQQMKNNNETAGIFPWEFAPWPEGNIYDSRYYEPWETTWLANTLHDWNPLSPSITSKMIMIWEMISPLTNRAWNLLQNIDILPASFVFGDSNSKQHPYTYPLKKYLSRNSKLNPMLSLFDTEQIKVSFNFSPDKRLSRKSIPFIDGEKPIRHLLLAYNDSKPSWEVTLIDQKEASYFRDILIKSEREEYPHKGNLKLCLFDIDLGIIQKGHCCPTSEELQHSELVNLLARIKFLRGEKNYSEEERLCLKELISLEKWKEIRDLYRELIAPLNPLPEILMNKLDDLFK